MARSGGYRWASAAVLALAGLVAPARAADPVVGAAGDIACDPSDANFNGGAGTTAACHMQATAALVGAWMNGRTPSDAAVLVLGDNQYENGALSKYLGSYDP